MVADCPNASDICHGVCATKQKCKWTQKSARSIYSMPLFFKAFARICWSFSFHHSHCVHTTHWCKPYLHRDQPWPEYGGVCCHPGMCGRVWESYYSGGYGLHNVWRLHSRELRWSTMFRYCLSFSWLFLCSFLVFRWSFESVSLYGCCTLPERVWYLTWHVRHKREVQVRTEKCTIYL